ncbi:hypothetical protein VIGAN_01419000 [Vigna angularis var. angularis]|uniref:Uncharacterized protein n=1 Tax=Vigna angularis var. angularis TaxID=157739 RepID=A0A0S3R6C8_PHAAN|nr:hypothetical protein VIGAN_01419000 [Vigna angularis var. angularis]
MEEEKCFRSSSSKVSRSRSVGCGNRSFSADFFERISFGLGDCTLRRVESHREGKHKVVASASSASSSSSSSSSGAGGGGVVNHCMKERVRCGGIFGGFAVTSLSSYAYSSSWVSSTVDDGRGRSWGWAFSLAPLELSPPKDLLLLLREMLLIRTPRQTYLSFLLCSLLEAELRLCRKKVVFCRHIIFCLCYIH